MKRVALIILGSLLTLPAFATPGYWTHVYLQGYSEYELSDAYGNTIYLSCNVAGSNTADHDISISIKNSAHSLSNSPETPIEFLINNRSYYVPDTTFTNSGSIEWENLMHALSNAHSFRIFWNGEAVGNFQSKNHNEVLHVLSECAPMIERKIEISEPQDYYAPPERTVPPSSAPAPKSYAHSSSLDVRYVVQRGDYGSSNTYVYALSREDSISITGITANRGQCQLFRGQQGGITKEAAKNMPKHFANSLNQFFTKEETFPVHLGFGQQTYFVYPNCPNILEVTIETNKGNFTYQF